MVRVFGLRVWGLRVGGSQAAPLRFRSGPSPTEGGPCGESAGKRLRQQGALYIYIGRAYRGPFKSSPNNSSVKRSISEYAQKCLLSRFWLSMHTISSLRAFLSNSWRVHDRFRKYDFVSQYRGTRWVRAVDMHFGVCVLGRQVR